MTKSVNVNNRNVRVYDVLGIGFGPSNLSLAIAMQEAGSVIDAHFIESAGEPNWHPGMLLNGADIQNNPLRDLVTPRNPQSYYTFINFLKSEGKLFDFLNLGIIYPLRKDYARYFQWAAKFFDHLVSYDTSAHRVTYDRSCGYWLVETTKGAIGARAIVVGIGRSRNVPDVFAKHLGKRVFHLCDYLGRVKELKEELRSIAVVGASQSAVEILNDLMARDPDLQIHSVHRSFSMRQKDTSPFSDHVYFPEFVNYFFEVDDDARENLQNQLRNTNYNSADLDVLHQLYLNHYEEKLDGRDRLHLHNNCLISEVRSDESKVSLKLEERFLKIKKKLEVDAVVLATGFKDLGQGEGKEHYPPILEDIADGLSRRNDNALDVERDYQVQSDTRLPLYLNGLCESSHGLGDAGSFSLLSLRSQEIYSSLERYFQSKKTVIRQARGGAQRTAVPVGDIGGE